DPCQPSTTAAVKARMTNVKIAPEPFDPTAIPTKAAKYSTPVAIEYADHPGCPRAANRLANTKHAAIRHRNPNPPLTKCSRPSQPTVWASGGVPGGKPSAGSATKSPAPISPTR